MLADPEKKTLRIFGERVRKIRSAKKLTVYDVTGEDMPIKDRQHWQKIENGQKNITLITLVKIATSLEVDPSELLKDLI